jgi:hypothetical protein
MRVVAMLACPSHSCTLAMSASCSSALVDVAERQGAQLRTAQTMAKLRGQDGAIALALQPDDVRRRRIAKIG